ncbi:hypothetical protein ACU5AX_15425 [Sphingomonas sp. XXL09]|uniref:hypothetical protein n=1 Tax=Sphingomonas sp. XXL09 TaxID=3457787 RepID=UPI00406BA5F0
MRIGEERLVLIALRALDDVTAAVAAGAVLAPTAQLRLLLAVLHDAVPGDGRRAPFDAVWRIATRRGPANRRAAALRSLRAEIVALLAVAAPEQAVSVAIRSNDDEERQQKAWERRGKHCPIQRPMFDRWPTGER